MTSFLFPRQTVMQRNLKIIPYAKVVIGAAVVVGTAVVVVGATVMVAGAMVVVVGGTLKTKLAKCFFLPKFVPCLPICFALQVKSKCLSVFFADLFGNEVSIKWQHSTIEFLEEVIQPQLGRQFNLFFFQNQVFMNMNFSFF